jgi:hypothetical protein
MNTFNPLFAMAGLTRRETEQFSLVELVREAAAETPDISRFREVSDEIARRIGRRPETFNSFLLPGEVLTRDLSAAANSQLVGGTEPSFAAGLFGGLLGKLPLATLPAVGNVTQAGAASAAVQWLSTESTQFANADPTLAGTNASPKTVGAVVFMSRQLALQTGPAGEGFVGRLLGSKLAEAVGAALINGAGAAGEPLGMMNIAGATSTSGTALGWAGLRDLLAASEGYDGAEPGFVLGATAAKLLRSREKASGSGMVFSSGTIDGIQTTVTRCCPSDALVIAPWSRVTLVSWGNPELTVTPFATPGAFQSGRIGLRLVWSLDFLPPALASVIGKSTSIT